MEPFETFEHAGFICELHCDEDPSSPADWDQLGTMHAFRGTRNGAPGESADSGAQEAWELAVLGATGGIVEPLPLEVAA